VAKAVFNSCLFYPSAKADGNEKETKLELPFTLVNDLSSAKADGNEKETKLELPYTLVNGFIGNKKEAKLKLPFTLVNGFIECR
jgi:hypothetical protein